MSSFQREFRTRRDHNYPLRQLQELRVRTTYIMILRANSKIAFILLEINGSHFKEFHQTSSSNPFIEYLLQLNGVVTESHTKLPYIANRIYEI